MTAAYITFVGTMKEQDSEEEKQVTFCGMADVIMFTPGSPPPRPSPGPNPPGIWGGGNEPFPTPPIAFPPGWGGGVPPGIWGGGNQPFPTPPISGLPGLPGYEPPKPGEPPKWEPKAVWSPSTGWVVVLVPGEGTLVPTPSK